MSNIKDNDITIKNANEAQKGSEKQTCEFHYNSTYGTDIYNLDELLGYLAEEVEDSVVVDFLYRTYNDGYSHSTPYLKEDEIQHLVAKGLFDCVRHSREFREYIQVREGVEFVKIRKSVIYYDIEFFIHFNYPTYDVRISNPWYFICMGSNLPEEDARAKADEYAKKGWVVEVERHCDCEVVYTPIPAKTPPTVIAYVCAQVESYFQALCPAKFEKLVFTIGEDGERADLFSFVEACANYPVRGRYLQDNEVDRTVLFVAVKTYLDRAIKGEKIVRNRESGEPILANFF